MHELSICQATIEQIINIGRDYPNRIVSSITLQIGPLSGVEPLLLEQAFPLVSINTITENAKLIIESLPVKVRCLLCGNESEVAANRLLCQKCGAWQTKLISGDEMLLASLEFE
ncbi:hydrogenase maturation nickel metallochaperone HypA [Thiotrichales bacterium HSG1]|nr:hydrogenase maturation nickel metallochaperone HypA [Thiotrichales bacterium HSG1]